MGKEGFGLRSGEPFPFRASVSSVFSVVKNDGGLAYVALAITGRNLYP